MLIRNKVLARAASNFSYRNRVIQELSHPNDKDETATYKQVLSLWLGSNLIDVFQKDKFSNETRKLVIFGYYCILILDKTISITARPSPEFDILRQCRKRLLNYLNNHYSLLTKNPEKFYQDFKSIIEKMKESSGITLKPELDIFYCYADQNYWCSYYYFIQCDKKATHQQQVALIGNIEQEFPSTDVAFRVAKIGSSSYDLQDEFRMFCNLQLNALKQEIQNKKTKLVKPEPKQISQPTIKDPELNIKPKKCFDVVINFFNKIIYDDTHQTSQSSSFKWLM